MDAEIAYRVARQTQAKAEGRCPSCGQAAEKGHTRCLDCRAIQAAYYASNKDKIAARVAARYEKTRTPIPGWFYIVYSGNAFCKFGMVKATRKDGIRGRLVGYRTHAGPHAEFIYMTESEDASGLQIKARTFLKPLGKEESFDKILLPELLNAEWLDQSGWLISQDEMLNIATFPPYTPLPA